MEDVGLASDKCWSVPQRRSEAMEWIQLAKDSGELWDIVNTLMSFQIS